MFTPKTAARAAQGLLSIPFPPEKVYAGTGPGMPGIFFRNVSILKDETAKGGGVHAEGNQPAGHCGQIS